MKKTQITTGKVRFSYVHAFEPKLDNNGTAKYSVTLLIPKSDKQTLAKIQAAMENAKDNFREKNPGRKLPAKLATTLHDGDAEKENGGEYGPECKGHMVISVSSKNRPVVVYSDKMPMTDATELYSGCYGRAVINFYVYDTSGKIGLTAGLNGLMKLEDGEPLAGGIVTDADWDDDFDDYDTSGGLLD